MPRETHILRFKVVAVECSSLPNGQQYTITYHRGSTNRSTPCYSAQNGVINFAAMPEGAAVVHFKTGHSGARIAPKYIRFMVEEYTRGMPRRLVGETEVDVTQVLKGYANAGSGILTIVFRLYGTTAKMKVAVLAYPEHAPPLSFDGLIDPADAAAPEPPQTVKVMNRGEAMMILMGLETLLERRRTMEAAGEKAPQSREEKKLAALEERRKALVGSEGLATEVVKTRCEEVVAVQFTALARKYRNNFIGQTAAYLREMALRSGEEFAAEENERDTATTKEQLDRVNRSIDDAQAERQKLEDAQIALGRIQHKVDVTQELCANLEKVGALDAKLKLLEQSRDALAAAVQKQTAKKDTELSREVAAINARITTVQGEQQPMRTKITHMDSVAAGHVVKWARSKNPPEPEVAASTAAAKRTGSQSTNASPRSTVDDLFSDAGKPERSKESQMLDDVQRRQVMNALKGLQASAPPLTAHSPTSASSSSGHRTPRDLFAGQEGLPSMGDFSSTANTQKKEAEAAAAAKKKKEADAASVASAPPKPSVHEDPLKPSGLGMDMFAAAPPSAAAAGAPPGMPSMNDFARPAFTTGKAEAQPMFDLSAMAPSTTSRATAQDDSPGFVLEPQRAETAPAAASAAAQAPAATVTTTYNKKDDPYYDEMDDFTVGAANDDNNANVSVEFTGGFAGFGDDAAATSSPVRTAAASSGPAPRPTFDFGPSSGGGGGGGGFGDDATTASSGAAPAPAAFSFVGGGDEPSSTTNRDTSSSNNPYSGMTNLPTYNFGS